VQRADAGGWQGARDASVPAAQAAATGRHIERYIDCGPNFPHLPSRQARSHELINLRQMAQFYEEAIQSHERLLSQMMCDSICCFDLREVNERIAELKVQLAKVRQEQRKHLSLVRG